MRISEYGINFIAEFEGFREQAYKDVAGVWTIGYGSTLGVQPGQTITKEAARARLEREIEGYEDAVEQLCVVPPNQNQFDALCSFAYNVGVNGLRSSSVLKAHNRGDFDSAARAFSLWNKAGGRVYRGLTRRRAAEAALYLEPLYSTSVAPDDPEDFEAAQNELYNPQVVDVERPVYRERIVRTATAAGSTAAVVSIAEISRVAEAIERGAANLDDLAIPTLLIVVVGLCGSIFYDRVIQRRDGRA